ncbi:MAG TPA: HAMP domain-containing sensor histidine kinase [Thermodesulfobacteriota bacterium]|nr:HAMP domain-containing sensor histidine kinase [Thermodesulfobacteriota bacterium]
MRTGKLYIKILLSFLAVLFITFLVIFALFHDLPGKYFRSRLEDFARTKADIIKETVEGKIRSFPETALSNNEPLKNFIQDFGKILGARIWLQYPDNTIAIKSFPDEIPEGLYRLKRGSAQLYGDMTVYHQKGIDLYAIIPFALFEGKRGTIHVLFERQKRFFRPDHPEAVFALGLFIIGLLAALLFIPISRIITSRLKGLRRSALAISEGTLSHRAVIQGRDEISELAQAFNRMTDKLEGMIVNAREMTANVSHELRTPLTRIRVSEEILREKLESGDAALCEKYLDEIREDIQELDQLISRILEWSKLDMQASPLVFALFNPVEQIQDLLQRLQPLIDRRHLRVESDLSFTPPFSGDQEALSAAFLNILDNAVKFTPENGQIHIRTTPHPELLEFSITNTFEKLPEEELSRIFVPFHRAHPSLACGSGLGLAIAKKIIGRHGGTIEARNGEKGLEMKISLPRKMPGGG